MANQSAAVGGLRDAPQVRQKSGLVRNASGFDAFVFSLSGISVGIMVSWGTFFGTGFYPGANGPLAIALATITALFIAWGYQYWGRIFPRTGGDYVFVSRGLHPGIALGGNFVYTWVMLASPAFAMGIFQPLLVSFASAIGSATGIGAFDQLSTWLNGNLGYGVSGTLLLAIASVISLFGLRPSITFMKVLFLVGTGGIVITMVALVLSSTSTFLSNLNDYAGVTASTVDSTAVKQGFAFGGFDFGNTMKLSVWYATSLFFASLLLYIGGEIKQAQRNIRWSMTAAVAFSGLLALVWTLAFYAVIPDRLQGALAYNAYVAPTASTPNLPYPHEMMRVLWGVHGWGLVLTLIGYLSILAWVSIWTPLVLAIGQRAVLAWSLDGLFPRWASNVSERWHTPTNAVILAFLMAEFFMLLFAIFPSFRTIVLLVPLYFGLALTMAVGTFFPFVRKSFYDQSIIAGEKVAGIPLMTVTCAVSTVLLLIYATVLWRDPVAAGTDNRPILVSAGILILIALYYVGLRIYKRQRGEDISVTFKRIPVE